METVNRAKAEQDRKDALDREKRKVAGCLDQLTRRLITFDDEEV